MGQPAYHRNVPGDAVLYPEKSAMNAIIVMDIISTVLLFVLLSLARKEKK